MYSILKNPYLYNIDIDDEVVKQEHSLYRHMPCTDLLLTTLLVLCLCTAHRFEEHTLRLFDFLRNDSLRFYPHCIEYLLFVHAGQN